MDGIEYLTDQHLQIESLFDQFESAIRLKPKLRLWRKLADFLAVHRAIEEKIFLPAARHAGLEELVRKALAEHLSTEPIIAELVEMDEVNGEMMVKMSLLRAVKRQHADDEEKELFPRARKLLPPHQLEMLGRVMANMEDELMGPGATERLFARVALA